MIDPQDLQIALSSCNASAAQGGLQAAARPEGAADAAARPQTAAGAEKRPLPDLRLVIMTNREPFSLSSARGSLRLKRNSGGVVSALLPVVETGGGRWLAWHTGTPEERQELTRRVPYLELVDVSADEVRSYYEGFANGALWPLFHYALDRCRFSNDDWDTYVRVNERFADQLGDAGDALVWVHDYQLCLVPRLLRERNVPLHRLAYFHHVPFPPPDVFRVLPWHRQILEGLLGADQIGFHTESYVINFLRACELLPDAQVDFQARVVHYAGRSARVGAFPIGVDAPAIEKLAQRPSMTGEAQAIRTALRVDKLLLSVDRLDYTKGIAERFEAIDRFFTVHPQLKGVVSLLQIAVPSRTAVTEYRRLKKEVDELVGRVNGKHAEPGWQPIHCTYRSFSLPRLVAHYRAADVALVTPVRDGMNLVAKEFCASRVDDDGVLILSEFAGAAESLGRGTLTINPLDVRQFVAAIERALMMKRGERRERMAWLRRTVAANDISGWVNRVVAHATQAW